MICKVLNYCFRLISRFSENTRSIIRTGLYFVLFFVTLLYAASVLVGVDLLIKCLVGAGLLGLIILFTLNGPVQPIKWNKPIIAMWFGMGVLQLVSGLAVSFEYLPMSLIWLVGFPVLFLVWNNRRDYIALFREVATAGNLCYLILVIISLLFYPLNEEQYGGFVNNSNAIGQWSTFAFPLILFLYHHEKGWKKWLYCVEIGILFLFCFVSKGRTAVIAVGAMALVYAVLRLKSKKNDLIYFLKKGLLFLMCGILICGVCVGINQISRINQPSRPPAQNEPSLITTPSQEAQVVETTPTGDALTKFIQRMLGKDKGETSLESYSSGRTGIWLESLKATNLLGHPSSDHIITRRNGDVGNNVHNTILQWIYDNGVITGILYVVMMIWSGVILVKRSLCKNNLNEINSYMLLIHTGFVCTSLFASVGFPFLYLIGFLYYLSFGVLFDGRRSCPDQNAD